MTDLHIYVLKLKMITQAKSYRKKKFKATFPRDARLVKTMDHFFIFSRVAILSFAKYVL